jgi:hypothetical protein
MEAASGSSSPEHALATVLGSETNAPHAQHRQLACISASGETAGFTGQEVVGPTGTATGRDVIATGNLLTDAEAVPAAMVAAFERSADRGVHLAERLLLALEAGEEAGGEQDDCHSAVLLVSHDDASAGWPLVNLRVDWVDSGAPLVELRQLWARYEPQLSGFAARAANPGSLQEQQQQQPPPPEPTAAAASSAAGSSSSVPDDLSFRGHSILLYFDQATEAALLSAGQQLHSVNINMDPAAASASLGVAGQRYGYRPHISLAICGGCDLRAAAPVLQRLAQSSAPFELTLGALATGGGGAGLFAAEGLPSLMLLPTVTTELLALHTVRNTRYRLLQ